MFIPSLLNRSMGQHPQPQHRMDVRMLNPCRSESPHRGSCTNPLLTASQPGNRETRGDGGCLLATSKLFVSSSPLHELIQLLPPACLSGFACFHQKPSPSVNTGWEGETCSLRNQTSHAALSQADPNPSLVPGEG